ncbi:DUF2306 domain-containing protein [Aquimarina megaterium]|uniref:DUF2306 domain-containing protein n=1 Tax=Aquimarina megaterium TaxID=1443666 RepID=UPI0004720F62|nr:DUF2306 domain-containing protein [Aquimarina megaterium]
MKSENSSANIAQPKAVRADKALSATVAFWFLIAVIGQWIFVYYVTFFYGSAAVKGDFEKWNEVLPHGYIPGETMGNLAVALHIVLAIIIIVGGPLQFIPQIRIHARTFHRWNGRIYIFTALLIGVDGLYMIWTRGNIGGLVGQVSVSINAFLIMFFAIMSWRTAVARDFDKHRRWALRLFLASNGVWFFRIGLMFWLFVNGGPVGFDPETFRGPFLVFLGFGQFLVPLAILELYLRVQDRSGTSGKIAMTTLLFFLTIMTGIGIFAATMGMWLPRI